MLEKGRVPMQETVSAKAASARRMLHLLSALFRSARRACRDGSRRRRLQVLATVSRCGVRRMRTPFRLSQQRADRRVDRIGERLRIDADGQYQQSHRAEQHKLALAEVLQLRD